MDYQNFDVEITADGLEPVARTNYRGRGSRQVLERIFPAVTADETATGAGLFRWLFCGEILTAFRHALAELPSEFGLRIRLLLETRSPASVAINSLPWELLYDKDRQRFLARDPATPLVRILEGGRYAAQAGPPGGPIRILLATASPADLGPLQLRDELLRIRDVIPGACFEVCGNATRERLQRCLTGETFHVFHLMGHGGVVDGKRRCALEKEDHNSDLLTPLDFIQLLPFNRYPLLTVLNFCWSAHADATQPNADFASSLVAAGLPAVLGLSTTINDRVAIEFSQSLYQSLCEKLGIEEAVAIGRTSLKQRWSHPILYMQKNALSRLYADSPVQPRSTPAEVDMVKKSPDSKASQITIYGGIHGSEFKTRS